MMCFDECSLDIQYGLTQEHFFDLDIVGLFSLILKAKLDGFLEILLCFLDGFLLITPALARFNLLRSLAFKLTSGETRCYSSDSAG
jgi:hypothetical protein